MYPVSNAAALCAHLMCNRQPILRIYQPGYVVCGRLGVLVAHCPASESTRTKRVVKYRKGYDMWTYVAGGKRLPGESESILFSDKVSQTVA